MSALLQRLAEHPLTEVAGWTLVHFLWQGLLITALAAVLLACLRRASASTRYIVACGGMALMALAPLVTAAWLTVGIEEGRALQIATLENQLEATLDERLSQPQHLSIPSVIALEEGTSDHGFAATPPKAISWGTGIAWRETLRKGFPCAVVFWLAGVLLLSLRLLGGLWRVRQWRRRGVAVEAIELKQMTARLAARMGLKRRFELLQSAQAAVPAVIGWLKPVVIVPASLMSGLTPDELESLLAHELAHIRRHDYLINLLQTIVETILFYHPAVWWLSGVVRCERENCCDDAAVEACGNRIVLVRALARMEELRCGAPGLALSARGGSLLRRVQRLLAPVATRPTGRWPAGIFALVSVVAVATSICMAAIVDEPSANSDSSASEAVAPLYPADPPKSHDDDFANHQPEVKVVDSVTGQSHDVLSGVKLSQGDQATVSRLDMKYSNLMPYTFIPARIAKELGAADLGEIDFGEAAPPRVEPQQLLMRSAPLSELVPPPPGGQPPTDEAPRPALKAASDEPVFVDDHDGPADERKIVPYPNDPIWVPDHLSFYGVNQTHQTKFRVVRIEAIDLGLGPRFGPVNALVLDDANTSIGVLGSNWARIPRGPKGESFVHSAVDGFWFMALPQELKPATDEDKVAVICPLRHVSAEIMENLIRERLGMPPRPSGEPLAPSPFRLVADTRTNSLVIYATHEQINTIKGLVKEADVPPDAESARNDGKETVLAEHAYDMSRRESSGWIEVGGVSLPVDDGPEAAGVKVHVTLMMDVVAVDVATGKVLWHHDWNKQDPVWQKATILETDLAGSGTKKVVVEFETADGKTKERFDLRTGDAVAEPHPAESHPADIHVVKRDGDRITLAAMESQRLGRTPVELLQSHADVLMRQGIPVQGVWVTDQETLVSAEKPDMLEAGPNDTMAALDAQEILFNLPEGSAMRAEFTGENVEISTVESMTTVIVTNGRVKLFDANGVERADASPDGGAEQLVIDVRSVNGEGVLRLQTRRIKPDADFPRPPVQVKFNLATGAPADEVQPPHGAVGFAFENPSEGEPARMKIRWHYDLQRLVEEAERESGRSWRDLLDESHAPLELAADGPFQTFENPAAGGSVNGQTSSGPDGAEGEWGPLAEASGLQSRLKLMTGQPAIGKPLLLKLELRNSRDKPTEVDLQGYAPFHVLRASVTQADGTKEWAPFIGMTPQTTGGPQKLAPGEVITVWENVDATTLFLLDQEACELFVEGAEWAASAFKQDSNHLKVVLQPGPLPRNQALIASLSRLETRPADWTISTGFGAIYLSHSPTNLKRDVTTIQLWFTEEPLPEDYKLGEGADQQEVTTIAPCQLGHLHMAAPPRAKELWPEYVRDIRIAAARALNFNATSATDGKKDGNLIEAGDEGDSPQPWQATGRVTDHEGQPVAGVSVQAHCGFGTLFRTGQAVTDAEGQYDLRFGPGIRSENKQLVQAATISVLLAGHVEQNLHRQGDMVAALEEPEGEDFGWGGKTVEDLFLPGQPKTIDFVMVPATKLSGVVIGQDGDQLDGVRVSLVGEDMPPSSSVVANTRTDKGGRFELTGIPTGFKYQILVKPAKADPPWLAWASPPMVFTPNDDSNPHFEYSIDGKQVDFSCQQMTLILNGNGVNWKTALSKAAEKTLQLTWDGLSTDRQVSAGMAFLELGENKE